MVMMKPKVNHNRILSYWVFKEHKNIIGFLQFV